MQIGGDPIRVRLNTDLTRYSSALTIGVEGYTIPNKRFGEWGGLDTFVAVDFDNGIKMDIAWKSLTNLDNE